MSSTGPSPAAVDAGGAGPPLLPPSFLTVDTGHYRETRPAADLAPFIDRFWGWWGEGLVRLPVLLPGTGAELYCHFGTPFAAAPEAEQGPGQLLCLRSRPLDLSSVLGGGFIAVRFRAGMLGRFLALPMAEVSDGSFPLRALWGRAGQVLAWRVREAQGWSARVGLLEAFLRARLVEAESRRPLPGVGADPLLERAVACLYRQGSALGIGPLAASLGLGRRLLERRFARAMGLSPAGFRGLVRFQKTARTLALVPETRVLDAALAQGYYDQAQCQHDFRQRAGMTPRQWQVLAAARSHFYKTSAWPGAMMRPPLFP